MCFSPLPSTSPFLFSIDSSTFVLEEAHNVSIKDVDYNPNKPYNLATGGDDCVVRFWDVRSISSGVPGGGHYSSGAGSRNTSAHNISSASSANNELLKPLKEVCNHSYW